MRTHTCGELRADHEGQRVALCGWVHARRGHGKLVFVDLRDRYGLTQIVFDAEDAPEELVDRGGRLPLETCVRVEGVVRRRREANPKIPTGEVEVVADSLEVLSETANPPVIPAHEEELPSEEVRMRHRYLDLRRPSMQRMLATRHRITKVARDFFDREGFLEIETPVLCRSTPEGARDFLVPSRKQPGMWYALPQSPQLFKQLLMMSGCDKYLQICRCFRDEEPRFDRQAEFSQIDLEMSFVTREQVLDVMERFVRELWREVAGFEPGPFPRMSYHEAMERFGIDRPDTRYGLELVDVSDLAGRTDFRVFSDALAKERGTVRAIRVPGAADRLTRKVLDGYSKFVQDFGAGGVPWTKIVAGEGGLGVEGGIAKFIGAIAPELITRLEGEVGDVLLFGADARSVCLKALGELRQKVAHDLDLIDERAWNFLWVLDFPMFEYDAEEQRFYAMHHPFTSPKREETERFLAAESGDIELIESIVSDGYDMVLNGNEIGGGSIRIHRQDVQKKVFELLGISESEAQERFSFLMEALRYGPPPMGGIAFGLDRLVMQVLGIDNIRDVMAFPKTHTGQDLLTGAPGPVDPEQLEELHVRSTA